ncbi:methyl-accepting chemotaxis protein [Gracilibacillus xinjiangensis]|uniref:Methyl-accepting chemotaxis protein n=1 Tax=Gracilibacillus xinjiangensis TaxID=1193282 RepID=A0ABV8WWY4_9BACI
MRNERNKLMHWVAGAAILLAILVNILGRKFHLFDFSHGSERFITASEIEAQFGSTLTILLIIPVALYILSLLLYRKHKNHRFIPYLLMLALTFASIAIISGGSGRGEFHFSVFMIVAAIGYYQQIKLVIIMTIIFAVQHVAGLFFIPEIVFGVEDYMFSMFIWHAVFLILTSSAVSWQIYSGKKIEKYYQEKQRNQRKIIIEEIVGKLATTTDQLSTVSDTLSNSTKNSYNESSQLTKVIADVSSSIEQQMKIMQENRESITQINDGIKSINDTAQTVAKDSNTTAEEAHNGNELIEHLLNQMKEIHNNVDESYEKIKELLQHSQSIEGIIGIISDIADQTNLLALNASIEAARAGDSGKGFAVVADEVRKLAEQSLKSSTKISEIIQKILLETDQSVHSMENVKSSATDGLKIAEKSNKVFSHISAASNHVASQVQGVSLITEELAQSSGKVHSSIQEITESANQSFTRTKEGMLFSERQHELTEATFDVSQKLNNLTSELEDVILTLKSEIK